MKDIPFTFGIITNADQSVNPSLFKAVQSIRDLHIPEYEIIIVGNKLNLERNIINNDGKIKFIDFNEKIKPAWITKKKNLITQHSKYDNIVYQHDYIYYDQDWYEGFKKFGDQFDVCMNKIVNQDGNRFRDWVLFPYHHVGYPNHKSANLWKYAKIENNASMLPYNETRLTKFQYISGSYWIAKKHVMLQCCLDESLVWEQGEDVKFSLEVLPKYGMSMNVNSTIHFDKRKQDAFSPIIEESLKLCIEFVNNLR